MPALNDADSLYLGTLSLSAAYLGSEQIWPEPALPENTVAPAITGSANVGSLGTCSNGTWTQTPTSYRRQWQRQISGVWTDIGGATSSTFTYVDEGNHRCLVWATNGVGESATYAVSNTVNVTAALGLATFANPNAYAALSSGDMVMSYTGAGGNVANVISSAAILEPTYFEMALVHSGTGYVGACLWAETDTSLIDYAVLGQWYDKWGVYHGIGERYSSSVYAFWGKTEQVNTNTYVGDYGGYPITRKFKFAVSGRNVWIGDAADSGWFGGGNPALGTSPSLVIGGVVPIKIGASLNNAANSATILTPANYSGTPPAGFRSGVAA